MAVETNKITDMIAIPEEEYKKLREDQRLLHCLQAAGIDNWEGMDIALQLLSQQND